MDEAGFVHLLVFLALAIAIILVVTGKQPIILKHRRYCWSGIVIIFTANIAANLVNAQTEWFVSLFFAAYLISLTVVIKSND